MRISPLDIRKQSFKKSMRGVDAEEVRIFLDLVASEYEKILQENAMMAERIRYQEDRLGEYRELEKSMRNSLVTADRIASEARESSEREANRMVQDAHLRAERILEDARERLQALIREIEALRGKKEIYARRFWTLIEGQIAVLQEHMHDVGEVESLRHRVEQFVAREETIPPAAAAPARTEAEPPQSWTPPPSRGSTEQDPQWSPPAPSRVAAEFAQPRAETPPMTVETRPGAPFGLGRLFRGRQDNPPPEEARPQADPGPASSEEEDRGGFFPLRERREGLFEITANETKGEGERARDRFPAPDTHP